MSTFGFFFVGSSDFIAKVCFFLTKDNVIVTKINFFFFFKPLDFNDQKTSGVTFSFGNYSSHFISFFLNSKKSKFFEVHNSI
jgi:hypothetical protein